MTGPKKPTDDTVVPSRLVTLRDLIEDLYAYLDETTLKRLWSYLWLPAAARLAWEERFPQLAELSRLIAAG